MKKNRIALFFVIVLAGLLLTGCSGLPVADWAGVTTTKDVVYVSYGGSVLAVDAATGSQKWRYPEKLDAARQFFAPPAVTDSLVVVGSQTSPGVLYGLDINTGVEKWSYADAKGKWIAGAIVVKNTILAPNGDGKLYALSLDGKFLWEALDSKAGLWATPLTDGELAYVASQDHNLYALNVASGKVVWQKDLGSAILFNPVIGPDGTIYLATLENKVLAVNKDSGNIRWTFQIANQVWASPVLVGDNIYIGDLASKIYSISAAKGTQVGQWDAPGPITSRAAGDSKGVVFAAETGEVFGITAGGEKFFNQKITGKIYSPLAAVNDLVIVGVYQGDNLLVAYDAAGKAAWSLPVPK
jgi:outer membrane protein assembly factor BamB